MKNKYHLYETVAYLSLMVLCIVYCSFALKMPFGKLAKPGQGFFPIILSLIGAALSAIATADSYKAYKRPEAKEAQPGVDFGNINSIRRLIIYVAMIVFFIIFADILGAYMCILIMIFTLSKIQRLPGLIKPTLLAVCSTLAFYLVFNQFLGVLLPTGLLL